MVSKIISCFIFCFAASVGADTVEFENPKSRVVGGAFAKQDQFPYHAQIKWRSSSHQNLFCGASIIHPKYVLTAARCVYDARPENLYVSIGAVFTEWGYHFEAERIILRDPYYEWDGPNDVALIASRSLLRMGRSKRCSINRAEFVTLDTISNEECEKYWGSRVTPDKICTMPKDGKGTCGTDAGGPLSYYGLQIGIIGWTEFECDSGKPELHTRVAPYANWISNIINGRFIPVCSEYTHV
ncbi:Trypsin [Popillia japonica]|uniref:Trypsin n=1 Tax=Popillia japonica TaxID=7064 RepID=A0AAW1NCD6_POPJA